MVLLNNLCPRFVELSFYSVARSLTVVCSFTLDFVLLGQRTTLPAIGCCSIVVAGFLLGNQRELRWLLSGVPFGLESSIFVALNATLEDDRQNICCPSSTTILGKLLFTTTSLRLFYSYRLLSSAARFLSFYTHPPSAHRNFGRW